jgi:hypothetical protein
MSVMPDGDSWNVLSAAFCPPATIDFIDQPDGITVTDI